MGMLDKLVNDIKARKKERKEIRRIENEAFREAYKTEVKKAAHQRGLEKARKKAQQGSFMDKASKWAKENYNPNAFSDSTGIKFQPKKALELGPMKRPGIRKRED